MDITRERCAPGNAHSTCSTVIPGLRLNIRFGRKTDGSVRVTASIGPSNKTPGISGKRSARLFFSRKVARATLTGEQSAEDRD
ncbi:hypothetical protein PoB_001080600 [Plakobranchus ocellatus]|uniref:Uncharacterized protein n=1 Tax=Plakobranchus ocellatus TaxID=259542 RepID=A0AAV3YLY9_9GAST|nr:hypothetical protein PoB_001080600 [Plakobranchus ocellatus]